MQAGNVYHSAAASVAGSEVQAGRLLMSDDFGCAGPALGVAGGTKPGGAQPSADSAGRQYSTLSHVLGLCSTFNAPEITITMSCMLPSGL